jgi:hypothetical protein
LIGECQARQLGWGERCVDLRVDPFHSSGCCTTAVALHIHAAQVRVHRHMATHYLSAEGGYPSATRARPCGRAEVCPPHLCRRPARPGTRAHPALPLAVWPLVHLQWADLDFPLVHDYDL